jgi:sulfide:quinone oxidoreductase
MPAWLRWTLPLYDLALLTARHAQRRALTGVEIVLASAEERPAEMFGRRASDSAAAVLEEAGVEFLGFRAPLEAGPPGLVLSDGRLLEADRVVALPGPSVAPIPGIPQGPLGFIGTDRHMQVESMPRVYAAGDVTWFPIKQGGLGAPHRCGGRRRRSWPASLGLTSPARRRRSRCRGRSLIARQLRSRPLHSCS